MAQADVGGEVSGGRWALSVPWLWVIWLCFTAVNCATENRIRDNARRIAELEQQVKAQQAEQAGRK